MQYVNKQTRPKKKKKKGSSCGVELFKKENKQAFILDLFLALRADYFILFSASVTRLIHISFDDVHFPANPGTHFESVLILRMRMISAHEGNALSFSLSKIILFFSISQEGHVGF